LKILFPTGSFYPAQTGGPDNSVYWLTKALTRQNTDVRIVSTTRGLPETVQHNQWQQQPFGRIIYTNNWVHYLPFRLLQKAQRQLREADVLHLTMIFYPVSFLMAFYNRWFYKKPMVWSIRGDLDPPMLERSKWRKRVVLALIRQFLKKHSLFHATCAAEVEYAKNVLGEDIQIVELTNYMELPKKVEVEKAPYFLFLGRIDPKKGIDRLIRALATSTSFQQSAFTLKIAGADNNEYGRYLQRLVDDLQLADRVEFLGLVKGSAKEELLAAAYFLFMPSHTENFGIVVAEALAQGTPAVASIYTPWQSLEQAEAGFWRDNSVTALRATIDHILRLPSSTYERMCRQAKQVAHQRFDVYQHINKWEKVYEQLQ
jgi:glycosyltransferase involved in cell wall biosynthesis